jgi:hypothetical protein
MMMMLLLLFTCPFPPTYRPTFGFVHISFRWHPHGSDRLVAVPTVQSPFFRP